jgi:hypothetical protein
VKIPACEIGENLMARGSKEKYTDKQKRKAEHIESGARKRGTPPQRAKQIAWATVNKESGGGKKSGSGRGHPESRVSSRKGGHASHKNRSHTSYARAGRKAAATRKAG